MPVPTPVLMMVLMPVLMLVLMPILIQLLSRDQAIPSRYRPGWRPEDNDGQPKQIQ